MKLYTRLQLLLVAFALMGMTRGMAVQTENHGIHAVPAPGKVTIDGKLDDWDLSGQVLMCYDVQTLRDIYSGQVAMMYDANNLYVSVHWKALNPMSNSHDPHFFPDKGWAGDALQLRIKTDRICHVTAWYYAAKKEPFVQIVYGKSLTQVFGGGEREFFQTTGWKLTDGMEEAFLKDADGKGYVQELKLPWSLITKTKVYKPGDQFNCGVELLWGSGDWPIHRYADNLVEGTSSREFFWTAYNSWGPVFLEPKGHLHLPVPAYMKELEPEKPQGPVKIAYTLPYDARVTLAINDSDGNRVRNLTPASLRNKGKNTELWDGMNDDGKPVPPGKYTYTALYHKDIHTRYTMVFDTPGNPGWGTADGRGAYYGDHVAAQAAAAAGDYAALGCPFGEAGQHLIGVDLTGQRLWGLANQIFNVCARITLATDGKLLWVGEEGTTSFIYRVEIATGRYAPWNAVGRDVDGKPFPLLDLSVTDRPGVLAGPASARGDVNLTAIALHNGVLAVCLAQENKIELRDSDTGALKVTLVVDDPRAVAFDSDGSMVALSGDRLVRVGLDGTIKPFNAQSFPDGYGLAVDPAGDVFLSVRGTDQNVKVFSANGVLLREIGKRGGRPDNGPFDDNAMRNPGQIALDSKGRLWVPEETKNPKRTSIWSVDGTLVKDLVGTTGYSGAGSINPYDPTMAFSENAVFKIDLATGKWRPVYSLAGSDNPADIFPPVADSHTRVMIHNGTTYVYTTDAARGASEVECMMFKDGVWRSVAHIGVAGDGRNFGGQWAKYQSPLFAGHAGQAYVWADQNGDGLVQANELKFGPATRINSDYWGQLPDENGTIPYADFQAQSLKLFSITGYTACGAPIYDIDNPEVIKLDRPVLKGGEGMIMGGANGVVYCNQDPLIAVDAKGHVLFTYPSKNISVHGSHDAMASSPGYLIGPSMILGTADMGGKIGEVFYLNGNLGENYLFTSDGLYIQTLFKDCRGGFEMPDQAVRGESFDETTAGGESFGGNFVRTPDGKCYVVLGSTDARVLEVTGLDTIRRFGGAFTYTPKEYVAAQELARTQAAKVVEPRSFTIPRNVAPVTIDGKWNDWPELLDDQSKLVEVMEGAEHRYGRVAMRYDDQNLYLGYRVFTDHERMHNSGQDPRLFFKTGDCVDLMLGPAKSANGVGNLRLLFSALAGAPTSVLYQKNVPGTPANQRIPFSSPWRTILFDRVTVNPDGVAVATGPINNGYFVEARVPWTVLGVTPKPGLTLKGDLGILFADSGGNTTVARQYWCNKDTGLVNDVPGEADLTPELWGTFTLQ